MSTAYVFDVATETAFGTVNPNVLETEIHDSAIDTVANPIEAIDTTSPSRPVDGVFTGGSLAVVFTAALSPADEAVLDGVVAAHTGPAFGAPKQELESMAVTSNPNVVPVDKLDLTAVTLMGGTYILTACWEQRLAAAAAAMSHVSTLVDGVEVAQNNSELADWQLVTYVAPIVFAAGRTPQIQVQLSRVGAAATAEIRRARVMLTLEMES